MSAQTSLWREMLAASEEALRGREFASLAEADRVVAEAHLRAIIWAINERAYPGSRIGDVLDLLTREADRASCDSL